MRPVAIGLPLRTRANVTDIANAVCQVLIDACTDLVDKIHNLNHGTPAGEDRSDHLKYFTEHLPATFIYAGIDVERCGVFTGTRGRQPAGRCELICTGAFPYRDEWTPMTKPGTGRNRAEPIPPIPHYTCYAAFSCNIRKTGNMMEAAWGTCRRPRSRNG